MLDKSLFQISPNESTLEIAKRLLGSYLVHDSSKGRTVGRIVETEAYLCDDPACHASRGETKRNRMMFEEAGHAYIYFIYGMYHCINVVTAKKGVGEAVLIRALEPIEGLELMQDRRPKVKNVHELCNGPGKLMLAMGIPATLNGHHLTKPPLTLLEGERVKPRDIVATTRIGISQGGHLPYRFYLKESKFISKL